MSWEALEFAYRLPYAIVDQLSPADMAVYVLLCHRAGKDGGDAYPPVRADRRRGEDLDHSIETRARVKKSQAHKSLGSLQDLGLIRVNRRLRSGTVAYDVAMTLDVVAEWSQTKRVHSADGGPRPESAQRTVFVQPVDAVSPVSGREPSREPSRESPPPSPVVARGVDEEEGNPEIDFARWICALLDGARGEVPAPGRAPTVADILAAHAAVAHAGRNDQRLAAAEAQRIVQADGFAKNISALYLLKLEEYASRGDDLVRAAGRRPARSIAGLNAAVNANEQLLRALDSAGHQEAIG